MRILVINPNIMFFEDDFAADCGDGDADCGDSASCGDGDDGDEE